MGLMEAVNHTFERCNRGRSKGAEINMDHHEKRNHKTCHNVDEVCKMEGTKTQEFKRDEDVRVHKGNPCNYYYRNKYTHNHKVCELL